MGSAERVDEDSNEPKLSVPVKHNADPKMGIAFAHLHFWPATRYLGKGKVSPKAL